MNTFLRLNAYILTAIGVLSAPLQADSGFAPSSISEDTIAILIQSGSGNYATSGAYLFQPNSSSYTTTALTPQSIGPGTYTYSKTGANTATLVTTDSGTGVISTTAITLTNSTTGSFSLSSAYGTQSGEFQVSYPRSTTQLAPKLADGTSVVCLISSGTKNLASSGCAYFQFGSNSNFQALQFVGGFSSYSGTYAYSVQSTSQSRLVMSGGTFASQVTYTATFAGSNQGTFTATATDGSTQSGRFYLVIDPAADLFNLNSDYGSGTYYSAWFGSLSLTNYPLVYQYNLGYEYVFPSGAGVYFYDYKSNHFWYTQSNYFPFLYDFSLGTFIYYYSGNGNPRYFYNYSTNKVISE